METTDNKRLYEIIKKLENLNIIIDYNYYHNNNISFNIENVKYTIFDDGEFFSLIVNKLCMCFDSLVIKENCSIKFLDRNNYFVAGIYNI